MNNPRAASAIVVLATILVFSAADSPPDTQSGECDYVTGVCLQCIHTEQRCHVDVVFATARFFFFKRNSLNVGKYLHTAMLICATRVLDCKEPHFLRFVPDIFCVGCRATVECK